MIKWRVRACACSWEIKEETCWKENKSFVDNNPPLDRFTLPHGLSLHFREPFSIFQTIARDIMRLLCIIFMRLIDIEERYKKLHSLGIYLFAQRGLRHFRRMFHCRNTNEALAWLLSLCTSVKYVSFWGLEHMWQNIYVTKYLLYVYFKISLEFIPHHVSLRMNKTTFCNCNNNLGYHNYHNREFVCLFADIVLRMQLRTIMVIIVVTDTIFNYVYQVYLLPLINYLNQLYLLV
jgi:hypothetical protein